MRKFILTFAAAIGMLAGPMEAQAKCGPDGGLAVCEISNGHYRIRTPEGFGPHPTVMYLYGSLGNSKLISIPGFVNSFLSRGYAVIVPVALNLQYADQVGSGWYLRHENGVKDRDDMKFIEEVLNDAEARHHIDRNRLLMAGMSRGGFLAWEIACHNPRLASAYAPVAAGYLGPMPDRCQSPVRMLHTHGRADEIVPLTRQFSSGGARGQKLDTALERMAQTGGCIEKTEPTKLQDYTQTGWSGCPSNASVDLLLHNGGHTIPRSWYSLVVDWFEEGLGQPAAPSEPQSARVGTPSFKEAGSRTGFKGAGTGTRFKGSGTGTGSRFKKPKVRTQ